MKQTSIDWYSDKLLEILGELVNNFTAEQTMANHYALKKAEEMHEQEIIEAHIKGHNAPSSTLKHFDAEQYYEMTYGKGL
jgi:hypothetical protein